MVLNGKNNKMTLQIKYLFCAVLKTLPVQTLRVICNFAKYST